MDRKQNISVIRLMDGNFAFFVSTIIELVSLFFCGTIVNCCSCGSASLFADILCLVVGVVALADIFMCVMAWNKRTDIQRVVAGCLSAWLRPVMLYFFTQISLAFGVMVWIGIGACTLSAIIISIIGIVKARGINKHADAVMSKEYAKAAKEMVKSDKAVQETPRRNPKPLGIADTSDIQVPGESVESTKALEDFRDDLNRR